MRKKKILFVINTLGRAGAEVALLSLFSAIDPNQYELSLYVMMAQGEMKDALPSYVHLKNPYFSTESVLTEEGRRDMMKTVLRKFIQNGKWFKKAAYMLRVWKQMHKNGKIMPDKILWRVISDGSEQFDETFDLAVAYLEGASTYYVADHVKARQKAAFVHIDYESSGYTPLMDKDCYRHMDRIFMVSDEVKKSFLEVYPECRSYTGVFHNLLDNEEIIRKSKLAGGFEDAYDGKRILTVGRLTAQKAYDIAIDAMKILKDHGVKAKWYVLGEGELRDRLQIKINHLGLKDDFILLGAKTNPYPYYAQCDLYVHATLFEGKSIAIQEAQILGCTLLVSDCSGNREQVIDGVDGKMCQLTPEGISAGIEELLSDEEKCREYGKKASEKLTAEKEDVLQMFRFNDN